MVDRLRRGLEQPLELVDYRRGLRKDGEVEVALLGGSFNPPTVGHMLAAHWVHATQGVDEVWLVPAFNHPFKPDLIDFAQRQQMCQLISDQTNGWLKVSDIEAQLRGDGRTVDMLQGLVDRYPNHRFKFVIGADLRGEMSKWKDPERIQELAELVVLNRPGYAVPDGVDSPLFVNASSTEVRQRRANGESVSHLVPGPVVRFMDEHDLYLP